VQIYKGTTEIRPDWAELDPRRFPDPDFGSSEERKNHPLSVDGARNDGFHLSLAN
jgi:hypothetical protein